MSTDRRTLTEWVRWVIPHRRVVGTHVPHPDHPRTPGFHPAVRVEWWWVGKKRSERVILI